MDESKIRELTQKFLAGTASEKEKNLLHQWYDQQYNHRDIEYRVNSDVPKEKIRDRIYRRLVDQISAESSKRKRIWQDWGLRATAAALLFLIVFTGINILETKNQEEWIIATIPPGSVQKILLPDSSRVWLNSGSILQYPKKFSGQKRMVKLVEGQAFFDVTRDEDHPFQVQSNKLVISVLGTSFDVKAYTVESTAKVSVQTGLVNVRYGNNRSDKPVELSAGEYAMIQKKTGSVTKELIQLDFIGSWIEGRLTFKNEPVESVLNALERKYNIKIEVGSDDILRQTVSIKVDNQPLKDILEVLQYTLGFEYDMVDEQILKIYK